MALNTRINLDNWAPVDPGNPLKSLAHEIGEQLDVIEKKIPASASAAQLLGYKGVCVDDGVEVTLDTIAVKLATSGARSLQFRVTTGTMTVLIAGQIYWTNNGTGNLESKYWGGNTLTTTYQQPFAWSFPWAGDNAVYNVQDQTNKRFYRITLNVGPGYKNNFIIIERLV